MTKPKAVFLCTCPGCTEPAMRMSEGIRCKVHLVAPDELWTIPGDDYHETAEKRAYERGRREVLVDVWRACATFRLWLNLAVQGDCVEEEAAALLDRLEAMR